MRDCIQICTRLFKLIPYSTQIFQTGNYRFLLQVFFMNHLPSSPWKEHLGHFKFFRKFAEIFACQGANLPLLSTTPAANFATSSTCVVDTALVANNGDNIRLQSLKVNLKAKIYIYMLTLLPKGAQTKLLKFFCLKIFSICHPTSVVDTGGALWAATISANFRKNSKWPLSLQYVYVGLREIFLLSIT